MLVTKKPETYEAIQFTGTDENMIEISKAISDQVYNFITEDGISFPFDEFTRKHYLDIGNYIVIDNHNKTIQVYSEDKFNQIYQECK